VALARTLEVGFDAEHQVVHLPVVADLTAADDAVQVRAGTASGITSPAVAEVRTDVETRPVVHLNVGHGLGGHAGRHISGRSGASEGNQGGRSQQDLAKHFTNSLRSIDACFLGVCGAVSIKQRRRKARFAPHLWKFRGSVVFRQRVPLFRQ
jgi:hypothetical protein